MRRFNEGDNFSGGVLVACFEPREGNKCRLGITFHQRRGQCRWSLRAVTLVDPDVGTVNSFWVSGQE